jgi:hypothetical protein
VDGRGLKQGIGVSRKAPGLDAAGGRVARGGERRRPLKAVVSRDEGQ